MCLVLLYPAMKRTSEQLKARGYAPQGLYKDFETITNTYAVELLNSPLALKNAWSPTSCQRKTDQSAAALCAAFKKKKTPH